jgi:hypothetical protein
MIQENKMGHKGVSKRKLPKEKVKPLATANHSSGLISGLTQSPGAAGRLSESPRAMPFNKGGAKPSSGSKQGHKNH